ncbi:MAG: DUF4209 domain-containing protein [Anaeroplasmataceae bacterium]|nr:DUF4209 domain-containing protein [Anaeroplasmataceae bacterium]
MKFIDYFNNDISFINNNFNVTNFAKTEQKVAKFSYDCIKYFHYIDCYKEEKFRNYQEVDMKTILKYINLDLNPLLLARYYTYLYMNFKDDKYVNALRALEYYIIAFEKCKTYEYKCSCLNKIISISRTFKIDTHQEEIIKFLQELYEDKRIDHNAFDYHILIACFDYGVIDYQKCIDCCIDKMNEFHKCNGFLFDGYFELAIKAVDETFKKKIISKEKKDNETNNLYLLKSNLNEEHADELNNPIQQSHFYKIALKSMKDANVNPYSSEFKKLRDKLENSQKSIKDCMVVTTDKLDFSKYNEKVADKLNSLSEEYYIELLINAGFEPYKQRQIEQVEKEMEVAVLAPFISSATANDHGKTISKLRSVNSAKTKKEKNEIMLEYAFDSVKMLSMINGQLIRNLINMIKEKCPKISDYIDDVVFKSYIVPDSRKQIVIKGLKLGLEFDLESALNILIPQMENCIRELAGFCGESKYRMNDDYIESVNGLDYLLKENNILAQSIDEDIYFGLCSIFESEFGLNYRNQLAHGLIENFNKYSDLYVWWFCLFLIGTYS